MVADVVRRLVPGQETQCGSVQDLQVTCHLHITGTDKFMYNVDSKHLSPCVQLQVSKVCAWVNGSVLLVCSFCFVLYDLIPRREAGGF